MSRILHQYVPRPLMWAVAGDSALILVGVAAAAWLTAPPALRAASLAAWAGKVAAFALLCQFGLHLGDIYDGPAHGRELRRRWLHGLVWAALLTLGLGLLAPGMRLGSGRAVMALPVIAAFVLVWHLSLERGSRGYVPRERVLLVGRPVQVADLLEQVAQRPDLGVQIVGVVEAASALDVATMVRVRRPDRVVVSQTAPGQRLPLAALMPLERTRVAIERQHSFYASLTGRWPASAESPGDGAAIPGAGTAVISRLTGGFALLLAAPLLALIAVAVKLDSRGPVLYRQERVGRGGARFPMLKFRSMRPDAERGSGPVWASAADPRTTRIGRLLRTARLDELPQLWNLACGEMALLGPRPERPAFVARLAAEIPHYQSRHRVRPGITGWAQVRYPYGETAVDARVKLEYDLFYLKYFSLGLEAFVLLQTVKTMLLGRGAR